MARSVTAHEALNDIDSYSGNYGPVWDTAPEWLREYWTTSAGPYRAQASQYALQQASAGLGWRECAAMFFRAAIRSTHETHNDEMEASLHSRLAQLLQQMGDYAGEVQELDAANRLLEGAGKSPDVLNMRWEIALRRIEADIATKTAKDPLSELNRLGIDAKQRETKQQVDLEQTRGLALLDRGDVGGAAAAFGRAIEMNQVRVESARSWTARIPLIESAAPSYRNLTQIQLVQEGNASKALITWSGFRPRSDVPRRSIILATLPAGVAIWTVDDNAVRIRWADIGAPQLRRLSGEFQTLCASPGSDAGEIRRVGNRLYRALVGPELQAFKPGTISVRTESWLSEIPFAALTDDSGNYLFLRFQFVQDYGPPAESPSRPITRASSAVVVAAPLAAAPGQKPLPFLAAADREADRVAEQFTKAVVRRDASLEWFAANAPRADVFHFSGHGWANGGDGALIIPPGPDGEGRFVSSRDLAGQNWSGCQLAVLSACLTAAGETRGAVNNRSLVQALLGAGTHRVVAARWSIDSEATRAFMDGFYMKLVSGKSVAEALSGAAAKVAATPGWSHPYYWAGFDVFGSA